MATLSDQIRRAIDTCGLSRYRIAQETELEESTLCRFMAGRAITTANLDRLAELLRLSIAMKGPPKRLIQKARRGGRPSKGNAATAKPKRSK